MPGLYITDFPYHWGYNYSVNISEKSLDFWLKVGQVYLPESNYMIV